MQQNEKNFQYEIPAGEFQKRAVETDLTEIDNNIKDSDILVISFDAQKMQTTITHKQTDVIILQDKSGETYADAYMILPYGK